MANDESTGASRSASTGKRRSSDASASPARKRGTSAAGVSRKAVSQMADLTGKHVEGVTSIERLEDGWSVQLDVLELRRIPNTTDVLATYTVDLDEDGEVEGYRREHRYVRGVAGEEGR